MIVEVTGFALLSYTITLKKITPLFHVIKPSEARLRTFFPTLRTYNIHLIGSLDSEFILIGQRDSFGFRFRHSIGNCSKETG